MRELKLKYIIELVSNIDRKAMTDAKVLTEAQKRVRDALDQTGQKVGWLEKTLLHMGGVGSASADRQATYLSRLALRYQDVRKAAEGASGAMDKVAKIAAGVGAGAYTLNAITQKPMDYSMRLARMANTAFSERNAAGRVEGKGMLDAAIRSSVRFGGGSINDAAGTLDSMIASGAISVSDAIKLLPSLMKTSTASGAPAEQLGTIGVRAMQSFKIPQSQIGEVLNMAMVAGQAGGFELKDMAKWLPQAMAAGGQSGLSGIEGFRRILGSLQASVITAGTKDEAGNNVVNLLAKINSQDTANDFKKQGYDLPKELAKARGKGVNSLDAFIGFVDQIASGDSEYVDLKGKLKGAGSKGEKTEVLESMVSILQGKAVGKVIQDRQALMALVAEMNNRGYVTDVMDKTRNDTGAIGTAFDVIKNESGYKKEQASNEVQLAANDAFAKVAPAFNSVYETGTNLAREFPILTTGVVGATGALTAFTAALGLGGLVSLLTGGGSAKAGVAAAGELGATGAIAGLGGVVGRLLRRAPLLGIFAELASTSDSEMAILRDDEAMRNGYRGKGFKDPRIIGSPTQYDYLGLNSFKEGPKPIDWNAAGRVEPTKGLIDINVHVSDERVIANTTVRQQPSIMRLNPGNTNPAGYGAPR